MTKVESIFQKNLSVSHFNTRRIEHELTAPYSPNQNGVAESMNRTFICLARAMWERKQVEKAVWAEAVCTPNYVRNHVTSPLFPSNKTPYLLWKGHPRTGSHFRNFGCGCLCVVQRRSGQKLESRSRTAIYAGDSDQIKANHRLDNESQKLIISKDVVFDGGAEWHIP